MPPVETTDPNFLSLQTNPFGLTDAGYYSKPTFADIDGDGDLDAFVGEIYGNTLFFRNTGTATAPSFTQEATNPFGLTDVGYWAALTFADIDGDGDLDAFVGNTDGNTLFFRNTGTASDPTFTQEANNYGLTDVGYNSKPTFADIDGDGDLDAFVGNTDGNTLFFRNTGTASDPTFTQEANNFGLTDVGIFAAPTFTDIDGDGDLDAFVGNTDGNTLFFRNTGTASDPTFTQEATNPFGLTNVGSLATPTFADIDGDGDLDAFVGNRDGNTLFFENGPASPPVNHAPTRSSRDPDFLSPQTNPFGLTDVGYVATPTFADIDGDGDLDAFVSETNGDTLFYRNTGTATAPSFTQEANNFGLTDVGYWAGSTFGDIDGDGDLDAFVGETNGNTLFYRNTGTASDPSFTQEATNPFGLTDVGYYSKPTLADIDGDGDLDAFVGTMTGNTLFFRNTGTATAPSFTQEATNFGLADVGDSAVPTFADIDGDGDLDAFVGNGVGNTLFFRNTGTASDPTFTQEATNPFGLTDVGYIAAPTFADIDGDGDLDAFVGNYDGNILFFENISPAATTLSNTAEDTAITITAADLLADFSDVDGDTLSVVNLTADNGALVDNNDGTYTFTPTANFNGAVTLNYDVSDGNGGVLAATQSFSVTAVDDTEFFVTNTNDSGAGSLRQAILDANADAGAETITFVGSVFEDGIPDTITLTSGELVITDAVTINGLGANNLSISGNNSSVVLRVDDGDSNNQIAVAIDGLKITDAYIGDFDISAAITNAENLTINNSTISGNNGFANAGIFNNEGTVTIANSIISDNTGQQNGAAPFGAGITNIEGTVTISNSTISGNTGLVGGISNVFGTLAISNSTISGNTGVVGGILLAVAGDGITTFGTATITNSTISGNTGSYIGGIANAGTLTLTSSTITNNSGGSVGGLLNDSENGAIATAQNSIIAGNTGTDASDIFGEVIGDGNNLIGSLIGASGTIGTGSDITFESAGITDISQVLASLANNGGATQTHALVAGSAALNAGNNTLISVDVTTDQRGTTRIISGTVDIGAYESDFLPPVNNAPTGSPTATLSDTDEDTEIIINAADLLVGFSDVDAGDTLSVVGLTADNGALVDNNDGTYTFTPTANFNGAVTLTYGVTDGTATLTGQTQTFSVTPVNDAPVPYYFLSPQTNPLGLTNVGYASAPTFADIDADGDLDAFVGNGDGDTLFYRNTGTATAPTFTQEANNFGLTDVGSLATPTFADIDADGDLDAFVGNYEGNTYFFRNTGTASDPIFTEEANNFGLTDVEFFAKPILADIDNDGDLDAFVGSGDGNTLFFRNTGTATAPTFTQEANNFGLTDVGLGAKPTFADIDGDGDLDAFVGEAYGNTLFFRNTGTATAPTFIQEATNPLGLTRVGYSASPTFADIDGDGDLDAFLGENFGNILFFENTSAATTLSNTTEDTAITITAADLLAGFSDVEGDTLSVVNLTANNGALVDNNDGTYTFTPTANFNGTVTLTYGVSDGTDTLAGQTQTFSVTPVNDAPTGSPTATLSNTAEDTAITITAADLLAGFSDVEGDTLSVVNLTADNGVLVDNNDGTYTFTPTANFNGAVTLTYGVSDGTDTLAGQTRSFSVTPVNDAPTGSPTATLSNTAEDTSITITAANLLAGFSDVEGDTLSVVGLTATNGSVFNNGNGTYTFTPTADFNGAVNLTYGVSDGTDTLADQTRSFSVSAVNDAPTGSPTATLSNTAEDTAITITAANLLAGFSDVEGDTLSVVNLTANNGALVDNNNGTYTFTPTANLNGAVNLTYGVSDGTVTLASQTQSFSVTAVNDAPVGVNDSTTTAYNTAVNISVSSLLVNDTDIDSTSLSITGVTSVSNGTAALNNNGTTVDTSDDFIVFTPTTGFSGNASFNYTVSDGSLTGTASVFVAVGASITGGNGQDNITGTEGNDFIDSGNQNDIIYGGGGNDYLYGGNGNDILYGDGFLGGGTGTDYLYGGNGDDILYGGMGNDVVTGNNGKDIFALAAEDGIDDITDFLDGQDKIGLYNGLTYGSLTISATNLGAEIAYGNTILAYLSGVDANVINSADFVNL